MMKDVFKVYFSHYSVVLYYAILFIIGLQVFDSKIFIDKWYYIFILTVTPFFEWFIHKYFLHFNFKVTNKFLKDYFYKIHEGHHVYPQDKKLVFAPFTIGLLVPVGFFVLFYLFNKNINEGLWGAFITLSYYVYYEWIHLAHTDKYVPLTSFGKVLRNNHRWHHFKNENFWWGVTTVLGDKFLNTNPDPRDIKKSSSVRDIYQKTA